MHSGSHQKRPHIIQSQSHVFTKFVYGDRVCFLLVVFDTDCGDDTPRLPGAFARDPADVLGINDDSVRSHDCRVLRFSKSPTKKFIKTVTRGYQYPPVPPPDVLEMQKKSLQKAHLINLFDFGTNLRRAKSSVKRSCRSVRIWRK